MLFKKGVATQKIKGFCFIKTRARFFWAIFFVVNIEFFLPIGLEVKLNDCKFQRRPLPHQEADGITKVLPNGVWKRTFHLLMSTLSFVRVYQSQNELAPCHAAQRWNLLCCNNDKNGEFSLVESFKNIQILDILKGNRVQESFVASEPRTMQPRRLRQNIHKLSKKRGNKKSNASKILIPTVQQEKHVFQNDTLMVDFSDNDPLIQEVESPFDDSADSWNDLFGFSYPPHQLNVDEVLKDHSNAFAHSQASDLRFGSDAFNSTHPLAAFDYDVHDPYNTANQANHLELSESFNAWIAEMAKTKDSKTLLTEASKVQDLLSRAFAFDPDFAVAYASEYLHDPTHNSAVAAASIINNANDYVQDNGSIQDLFNIYKWESDDAHNIEAKDIPNLGTETKHLQELYEDEAENSKGKAAKRSKRGDKSEKLQAHFEFDENMFIAEYNGTRMELNLQDDAFYGVAKNSYLERKLTMPAPMIPKNGTGFVPEPLVINEDLPHGNMQYCEILFEKLS